MTTQDYYSDEMNARRDKFNNIIHGIDMVLMNNIPEVDPSVWENFEGKSPLDGEDDTEEVFQWFAVNENDADYLKRHNQYITYSDMLDTYFLAITHFGTSWDYVDSMVDDILDDKEDK